METQYAYNKWAKTYDHVINKTRDVEGIALREILADLNFDQVLEIGCGTGKNTEWLLTKSNKILAVDLSEEMLTKAKEKIDSEKVTFTQANILGAWGFTENRQFDLISFSLVLEHISDLKPIFQKTFASLHSGGYLYMGELHPFKQYNGTKARFETSEGLEIVDCYNHHISDFLEIMTLYNCRLIFFKEYFDGNDRNQIPRILALLFQKN